jgi:hypothetical protein
MRKTCVEAVSGLCKKTSYLGIKKLNFASFNLTLGTSSALYTFLPKLSLVLIPSNKLSFNPVNYSLIHTVHIANNKYN